MISQVIDDIAGNPEWQDAAQAVARDLETLKRKIKSFVKKDEKRFGTYYR